MKTTKKLLAVLLTFALAFSMVAAPKKVANAQGPTISIFGKSIQQDADASGSNWTYEGATRTLTLKGVNETGNINAMAAVNIVVNGTNTINGYVNATGVVTFSGNGTVNINNNTDLNNGNAVSATAVTFNGANVIVTAKNVAVKTDHYTMNEGNAKLSGKYAVSSTTYTGSTIALIGGSIYLMGSTKNVSDFEKYQIGNESTYLYRFVDDAVESNDVNWNAYPLNTLSDTTDTDKAIFNFKNSPNVSFKESLKGVAYYSGSLTPGSTLTVYSELQEREYLGDITYNWIVNGEVKQSSTSPSFVLPDVELKGEYPVLCQLTAENRSSQVMAFPCATYSVFFDATEGKLYKEPAAFNPATWTPTNATPLANTAALSCDGDTLKIKNYTTMGNGTNAAIIIKGDAKVELTEASNIQTYGPIGSLYGIYAYDNVEIIGKGSIDIHATVSAITCEKELTINDRVTIDAKGYTTAIKADKYTQNKGDVFTKLQKPWTGTSKPTNVTGILANTFTYNGGVVSCDSSDLLQNSQPGGYDLTNAIYAEKININKNVSVVGGANVDTASASAIKLSTTGKNYVMAEDSFPPVNAHYVYISYIAASSVSIDNPSTDPMNVGDTKQLDCLYGPDEADVTPIWSSDNEDVATVDENGKITAVGPGTATITLTDDNTGKTDTITITVEDPNGGKGTPATSVEIDKDSVPDELNVGDTTDIIVKTEPTDADTDLTYKSDNEDVASVDEDGKVTANKPGTATITVTDENTGKTDTITITVKDPNNGKDPGNTPGGNDTPGNTPGGNDDSGNTDLNNNGNGNGNGNNVNGKPGSEGSATGGSEYSTDSIKKALDVDDKTAADITNYASTNGVSQDTLLLTDKTITSAKTDDDFPGSTFGILKAKCTKMTKKSLTITWTKVADADGYIVYGNKCGKKNTYKLIKTVQTNKTTKLTKKKLKKGTYYKYFVIAYKNINGVKVTIAASKTVHATTNGGKYGVAKAVKVNKTSANIKVGKTVKLTGKEVKMKKKIQKHRKICFESADPSIATVKKNGTVKGIKKGNCVIYVYAQNGAYKTVKVSVK